MAETKSQKDKEPSLFHTLVADFLDFFQSVSGGEVKKPVRKSFRELREFYIDEERRRLLTSMGRVKRWFLTGWWLLKAMLLKLSPVRRLFLVVGIAMLFNVSIGNKNPSNYTVFGGLIFLLILMFELKDKLAAKTELKEGHAVQEALLPVKRPKIEGWDIWLYYKAANEVGGDLLDFLKLDESRFGLALGDIADKGLKAALLMAKLQATLQALAPDYTNLAKLAAKINEISYRDGLPKSFASLVYLELAPKSRSVRLVNAGHLPPVIVGPDGVEEFPKGDPALGLSSGAIYNERNLTLKPDEIFVIYSDGVTEARNNTDELFGDERFQDLLREQNGLTAEQIGNLIVRQVAIFAGDAARADDLSLAIIKPVS